MSIDTLIERLRAQARFYDDLREWDAPSGALDREAADALAATQAEILRLKAQVDRLTADLAFADQQSAKVEALIEPHVTWEPGTVRICPMRDGPCPHGMRCPFVGESYHGYPCKAGWSAARSQDGEEGA